MSSSQLPQSLFCSIIAGNDDDDDSYINDDTLNEELYKFLKQLGKRDDVLLLPPDYTRFHSQAGKITQIISEYYNCIRKESNEKKDEEDDDEENTAATAATVVVEKVAASSRDDDVVITPPTSFQIMPALGTHAPMTKIQIKKMFGTELALLNDERETSTSPLFLEHKWKTDVVTIGHVPNEMVLTATNGLVNEPWPAQLNKLVWEKRIIQPKSEQEALVLSIGQVVPHEVMGMANYNKNLFVGVGGLEAINLSHFIGAVYGMENMMGRANNPLRQILNYASEHYLENKLDLWYILTVISPTNGKLKGLFIGNTINCYMKACELSMKINFTMLNKSPKRIVVYLDEDEFHSTWLGNKAIYRTRMAIADGGELIILAPGVCKFGETIEQDYIIRKYGYVGTPKIMNYLKEEKEKQVGKDDDDGSAADNSSSNNELQDNLGAVAHLIHGSSEDRFRIIYCPGPLLNKNDIHQVGFQYGNLEDMLSKYDINAMNDGWNNTSDDNDDEEEFYFIKNPALGLWAVPDRFEKTATTVDDVDK